MSWNPNGSPPRRHSQSLDEETAIGSLRPASRQPAIDPTKPARSDEQWGESSTLAQSQKQYAENQRLTSARPGTSQPPRLSNTTPVPLSTSHASQPQSFPTSAQPKDVSAPSPQIHGMATPSPASQIQSRPRPISAAESSRPPVVPEIAPPPEISRPSSADIANYEEEPFLREPFFILVKDVHTSEYHHPTVHYVFSDEDAESDLIANAASRSLDETFPPRQTEGRHRDSGRNLGDATGRGEATASRRSRSPSPSRTGVQEHYIIVDAIPSPGYHRPQSADLSSAINDNHGQDTATSHRESLRRTRTSSGTTDSRSTIRTSGNTEDNLPFKIKSAHSLSPTWHILNSSITSAPTLGPDPSSPVPQEHENNNALMMQIEGLGIDAFKNEDTYIDHNERQRKTDGDQQPEEDVDVKELLSRFETRMGQLRQIVDAGFADEAEERGQ